MKTILAVFSLILLVVGASVLAQPVEPEPVVAVNPLAPSPVLPTQGAGPPTPSPYAPTFLPPLSTPPQPMMTATAQSAIQRESPAGAGPSVSRWCVSWEALSRPVCGQPSRRWGRRRSR